MTSPREGGCLCGDPGWIRIERHTWTRPRQHWVPIPPAVEQFEKSAVQRPLKLD
jgi:hypothetical protein